MPAILSLVTSLLGRVIGSHLVGNNAAKAGTGTVQSLVEGFGMRFAVGAIAALYATNHGFRAGINSAVKAATSAIIG